MGKMYLTVENRSIGILVLIKVEHISMHKVDAFILSFTGGLRPFLALLFLGIK
jgi:hypothetical protein